MCGITGIFGNFRESELEHSIYCMSKSLEHRGPNDSGVWIDQKDGVAFGHRRLSVMDLSSAGHQPMSSPCGRYMIVFNGEIYNHLQLRSQLDSCTNGKFWQGHSDTETLLSAFSQWGIDKTLQKLVGMFAIAVWDLQTKNLSLIRDRFGEKPLYYGWNCGVFLFGSELKALRSYKGFSSSVDRNVLSLYMQYMYVPTPYSIFKNIYKLEPGCILQIDKNSYFSPPEEAPFAPFNSQGFSIKKWYSLYSLASKGQKNLIKDEGSAIELLEETLLRSVQSQLITDVPLGAFLSGGVDSSLIVSLMQKISKKPVKTFTIGFDESSFNEAIYAKEVAKYLGTEHNELYVTASDAYEVIPSLHNLYDEPFADSSQIPTYLVSKMARQDVTVSLSGDGGDELFCGYNRYLWGERIWKKIKWLSPGLRSTLGTGLQKFPISAWDFIGHTFPNKYKVEFMGDKVHKMAHRLKKVSSLEEMYLSLVTIGYKEESLVLNSQKPFIKTKLSDINRALDSFKAEHRMMLWDSSTYLPDDILTKVDRASMGVGLETRVPFLDHRVAELAWRLPLDMKVKDNQSKWILRQILYKYVPREIIERPKSGFGVPVGQWIKGPLRDWANGLLDEKKLQHEGYFDSIMVRKIWEQHLSGSHDWTSRLWAILMFQAWLDKTQ